MMRSTTHLPVISLALLTSLALCWGCDDGHGNGKDQPADLQGPGEIVRSDAQRINAPEVSAEHALALANDNQRFAFNLYQKIKSREDGNIFYSPHSISIALAMTYAGARGATAQEMAIAMAFGLPPDRLHPAFNGLDLSLLGRNSEGFELRIVNQLWGRTGQMWVPEFLDTLAMHYGAGLRTLDFAGAPEDSRSAINGWVEDVTEDRIKDLLPQGGVNAGTVLVLTNAIYFNAKWLYDFKEASTYEQPFTHLDGSEVQSPMMHQEGQFEYFAGSGYEAIELPYKGDGMSMIAFVPGVGQFAAFEDAFGPATIAEVLDGMAPTSVGLALPKIEFEAPLPLKGYLEELGMPTAFTCSADFSGMREQGGLLITDVVHKAFVKIDEEGTEAAAATAVVVGVTEAAPMMDVVLTIDRPFVFVIRDNQTGALLFVGRILDPTV